MTLFCIVVAIIIAICRSLFTQMEVNETDKAVIEIPVLKFKKKKRP